MESYFEEKKKKDQGVVPAILVICAVLALVAWVISKLVTLIMNQGSFFSVSVLGGVAAMVFWGISKWFFKDPEENIKFEGVNSAGSRVDVRGMLSNWLEGLDEKSLLFQRAKAISMAVGTVMGWSMLKLFGGKFLGATLIALFLGLVTAGGILNWLRSLEEEKRRKKRNGMMTSVLAIGAVAGLAALAGWGLSNALASGSGSVETSEEKDKMMKAPGRDYYMPRKDFEDSPSAYFRNLRAKNY